MATIELADISQELKKAWEQAKGENKIRASLFNLILYVEKNEGTTYYLNLVKSVISKFPCRVLLIIHDKKPGEEYLKSSVRTETLTGSHQIFCEIITIEVGGALQERAYSLLLPHLLCDLPIYLLWSVDPIEKEPLFQGLGKIATRVIFDSQEVTHLQSFAKNTLSLLQKMDYAIGDLHWSALASWRTIIRTFFDSYDRHQKLVTSKKMEITYALHPNSSHSHPEIASAYLQSWLGAFLYWQYRSYSYAEGYHRISYDTLEGECVVLLKGKECSLLPSGALLSIDITSQEGGASISFTREPKTRQVVTSYFDQDRCDLPYYSYLPGIEEGKEIIKEIFYPSQPDPYKKMLETLSRIPWSNR